MFWAAVAVVVSRAIFMGIVSPCPGTKPSWIPWTKLWKPYEFKFMALFIYLINYLGPIFTVLVTNLNREFSTIEAKIILAIFDHFLLTIHKYSFTG